MPGRPRTAHSENKPPRNETGTIRKKWRGKVPVCIVYPNRYYVGMSNLAVHILYETLNGMSDVVCERYFFEEEGQAVSLESGRPLSSFACLFFSLSFELDYVNVPNILRRAGIPVLASRREGKEPLVAAGGICVMANPEPVHAFFDLFLLGDVESTIPQFMDVYLEVKEEKRSRIVERLGAFPWAYDPAQLFPGYRDDGTVDGFQPHGYSVKTLPHLGKRLGRSAVIAEETEFSRMYLLEGTRGCPSRCPFCLLGNTYRFSWDRVDPGVTDLDDMGIIGGGVSFHPEIIDLMGRLKAAGKRIHLPSLRVDEIPLSVIDLIKDEVKTLTFGIEAGTERLRRFLGKAIPDREVLEKIDAIYAMKSFNLKLYFMIGLFSESQEDIDAIVDLVKRIKHVMVKGAARRGKIGSITVHASPFVPKAGTPFQWLPMADMDTLKEKMNRLKRAFGKVDNTYFTHESVKFSYIQGALARGDRKTLDLVLRLADGESLSRIMKESPVNPNFYVLRERGVDEVFPWDFIKGVQSRKSLRRRLETALAAL
jgi:radical SAM superfamily enzyme YgiQ (UPF0313 family)